MNPEQLPEVEQLWLANEAFAELQAQHMSGESLDPAAVEQFNANRDAYTQVGSRVITELTEVAPRYRRSVREAVVLDALRESDRDNTATEEDICLRALDKLLAVSEPPYFERLKALSTKSDAELTDLLRQKEPLVAEALVRRHHGFFTQRARAILNAKSSRAIDVSDLRHVGFMEFLSAAKNYDPSNEANLLNYAGNNAQFEMVRYLNEYGHGLAMPDYIAQRLATIQRLDRERAAEGLPPMSDADIAEEFDIPLKSHPRIKGRLRVSAEMLRRTLNLTVRLLSYDASVKSSDLERGPSSHDEYVRATDLFMDEPSEDPSDSAMEGLVAQELERALNCLGEQELRVIRAYYGLNEAGETKTTAQISVEMLCTDQNVGRIRRRALKKLRESDSGEILREFLF